jgi:hypothetical protein
MDGPFGEIYQDVGFIAIKNCNYVIRLEQGKIGICRKNKETHTLWLCQNSY